MAGGNWQERLAPIGQDVSGWVSYLDRIFRSQINPGRAFGKDKDLDPNLTVGYRVDRPLQGTVASAAYVQGRRGNMAHIPTPQDLIRQVTGIGTVDQGR